MLVRLIDGSKAVVPVMSATRIWDARDNPEDHIDTLDKIDGCINNLKEAGVDRPLVVINMMSDKAGLMEREWPEWVTPFGVTPWGFSMAVNGSIRVATQELENMVIKKNAVISIMNNDAKEAFLVDHPKARMATVHDDPLLLMASSEIRIVPEALHALARILIEDPIMLGIGVVLAGHRFVSGKHMVMPDERYHPWNTCLLWRLKYLGATGAPMICEGPFGIIKAQEEPMMSRYLQEAKQGTYTALAKLPDGWVEWQTHRHADPRWHMENLATKVVAVERQFGYLSSLEYPMVVHIDLTK